jgi:hypothetical protein
MTVEKFNQIKSKIEQAKSSKDRAIGAKQKIEENWKNEFDIDSIEEAENKVKEIEDEIAKDKVKLEKQYSQLEKITDWDEL